MDNVPTQETANMDNPEEHVAWALRNMPSFAGIGAVTHSGFLRLWSKHLVQAGFVHAPYLARLADEDGNIHVSQLPKQKIRWQPPMRGPRSQFNNAARWVDKDTPAPEPMRIPDIRKLTQQENEAMLRQYEDAGMLSPYVPPPSVAQELD